MRALSIGNGQLHQMSMSEQCNCLDNMHDKQAVLIGGGTEVSEPVMMSDRKGHHGITEDGTATTLNAQDKERPVVGGGDAMTSVVRRLTPLE